VGLGHRLEHYPSQLSGGEQQRVALARALAPRPSLVFADEPTGNLDGRTGAEIVEMMFRLQRERGSTLVLVTHDEALARRCDRIVRLRDGRIEAIEDTQAEAPTETVTAPAQAQAQAQVSVSVSFSPEPASTIPAAAVIAPAAVIAETTAPAAEAARVEQPQAPTPEPSTSEPPAPEPEPPAPEAEPPAPETPAEPFRLVEEDTVPTDALAAMDPIPPAARVE
jgi:ABC-type glutathione transport system ATPase component